MGNQQTCKFNKSMLAGVASSLAIMAAAPMAMAQEAPGEAAAQSFSLPAGPLGDAFFAITSAFDVNIIADERLVQGKTAPAVSGVMTAEDAIDRVLTGTDLTANQSANGAFVVTASVETIPDRRAGGFDTDQIEDQVVVTGTRIERTAVNSPAPIDIVTAEDIARLGLNDTTEALRFTPALSQSLSLSTQGDFRDGGPAEFGLGALNLRGLGANRTLVLVDGRRHVGGVANEATVDVATIPTALIDRVEILTGGGSSIYGADAVSGVVNYIMKDDFEGLDLRGNLSIPTQGEGEAFYVALTAGTNFAQDRGNIAFSLEYNKQNEVQFQDRAASRTSSRVLANNPQLAAVLGVDPNFRNVVVPDSRFTILTPSPVFTFFGSTISTANLIAGGTTEIGGVPVEQIIDPVTGEIRAREAFPFVSGGLFTQGAEGTSSEYANPAAQSIPDFERYSVNLFADYDFSETVTGFVEAKFVRSESSANTNIGIRAFDIPVQLDNPFVPQLVRDQFDSLTAQGLDPNLLVNRDFLDDVATGPTDTSRETFRIVGGVKGVVSKALSYEVSVNYGRTDTDVVNNAEALIDRFYAAADVVSDPTTGDPICRSNIDADTFPATGPSPGVFTPGFRSFAPGDGSCAPLNIFAPQNALDPEAAAFIFQRAEDSFAVEQFAINATVTGSSEEFLTLPAGGIGYAAGFEYRDERSSSSPDSLKVNALGTFQQFGPGTPVGGSFDVIEGFAEVNVPVVAEVPFAKRLDIDASVRLADYSTAGRTTSFAFGTVWQPVNDLRIRGSFNRSVRAPNISELFRPRRTFNNTIGEGLDPCDPNSVATGSPTRAQNCAQFIPDLENFDPSPAYNFPGIEISGGGSPFLNAETADTYTIGFAFTPSAIPGLAVVADYYDVEISDAIVSVSRFAILDNCVDAATINNPFCGAVTRNPNTGVIETVDESLINAGALRSRGIDYQFNHTFDLDDFFSKHVGVITANVNGTYLINRENQDAAGFPETINRFDGEVEFPKHNINFSLAWDLGPWSSIYGFNFQSNTVFGGIFDPIGIEEIQADPLLLDRPDFGSTFVHYLGGAYQLNDDFQVSLRVNNLLDRSPFNLRGNTVNPIRPVSFLGRTVQLGVQANF